MNTKMSVIAAFTMFLYALLIACFLIGAEIALECFRIRGLL